MATALQIQTFEVCRPIAVEEPDSHWLESTPSPREEARILFEMMRRSGGTVESFRELIAIPPEIEAGLTRYAYAHPEDAFGIERVVKFRKRVAEEFERLACSKPNTLIVQEKDEGEDEQNGEGLCQTKDYQSADRGNEHQYRQR
jgi:hypothetical protein